MGLEGLSQTEQVARFLHPYARAAASLSAPFMAHFDEAQLTCVLSEELLGIFPNAPLPNQVVSTSDRDLPG